MLTVPRRFCCRYSGDDSKRLQRWWELATPDAGYAIKSETPPAQAAAAALGEQAPAMNFATNSSRNPAAAAAVALSELHCGTRSTRSTADHEQLSNIAAVPGTSLLFDRRSLRARKPSVRFRNTGKASVHVTCKQMFLLSFTCCCALGIATAYAAILGMFFTRKPASALAACHAAPHCCCCCVCCALQCTCRMRMAASCRCM
jgi:hypothetical protein